MLTRSVVVATTLTVGLVAGVGSSALAIAFVPGNASGESQSVQAIAAPAQDPAEGSVSSMIAGGPVTIVVAKPITIDGGDETSATEADSTPTVVPAGEPAPPASGSQGTGDDSGSNNPGPGNSGSSSSGSGNSGHGNSGAGNSGAGNSGKSAEAKDKKDKEAKDEDKKDKEDEESESDE